MFLITGATGRVGGAVLSRLSGRVPVRPAGRAAGMVPLDIRDAATHGAVLDGVTDLFLMRPPQIARGAEFAPFLDAAASAGVRRVTVLSVKGADTNRILPHHGVEAEVRARGFDWTMIRPADFMQNLETVHRAGIRDRDEIAVPAGRGASAFVDVADVADAVVHVMTHPGHAGRGYAITGPQALDFAAVAAILSAELGRAITYRPPSIPGFVRRQVAAGTPVPMALVMSALYTAQRLGRAAEVTGDLSHLLGRPAGTMADYVARNRALWCRA